MEAAINMHLLDIH